MFNIQSTNLVRKYRRAVPPSISLDSGLEHSYKYYTDTCLPLMITSSCQEYWKDEWKRLNERLIGRICLLALSLLTIGDEKRRKTRTFSSLFFLSFFPRTYLDQFVITWFIFTICRKINTSTKWTVVQWEKRLREQNLMEKTCRKWYCVVLVFMACQTISFLFLSIRRSFVSIV